MPQSTNASHLFPEMDPPRTTLCPGYSYVDNFSPSLSSANRKLKRNPVELNTDPDAQGESQRHESDDGEDSEQSEYEEEIEYVVLDLGNIEPTLVPSSQTYRLIGLDTPTPYLQLSGTVLQGRHENLLGSELIFTDDKDATGKKKSVTHVSTTSKRISFKEVRLRPKERMDTDEEPVLDEELEDEDADMNDAEGEDDFDMRMKMDDEDVDAELGDALEYVDPDQFNTSLNGNAEAGPSCLPPTPILPPHSPAPASMSSLSESLQSKSKPHYKGKGKAKVSPERLPRTKKTTVEEVEDEDEPPDPTMQIERLTGILPTVARARKSGSAVKTREKGKSKDKGKQKESAES